MNAKAIRKTVAVVGLTTVLTAVAIVGFGRPKFTSLPILQGDSIARQDRPRANFASDAAYIYNLMGAKLPEMEATVPSGTRTGQGNKPVEGGGDAGPMPQVPAKSKLPDYGTIDAEGVDVAEPAKRMQEINQLLEEGNLTSVQIIRLKKLYGALHGMANAQQAPVVNDSAGATVPEPVGAVADTVREEQPVEKPVVQVSSLPGYDSVLAEGSRILGADSVNLEEIARVMTDIMVLLKDPQLESAQIIELKDIYRKLYGKGKNE